MVDVDKSRYMLPPHRVPWVPGEHAPMRYPFYWAALNRIVVHPKTFGALKLVRSIEALATYRVGPAPVFEGPTFTWHVPSITPESGSGTGDE